MIRIVCYDYNDCLEILMSLSNKTVYNFHTVERRLSERRLTEPSVIQTFLVLHNTKMATAKRKQMVMTLTEKLNICE